MKVSRNIESLKITGNDLTFVFPLDKCISNIYEVDLSNCQITNVQYNVLVNNLKHTNITKLTMCGVFGYGFGGFNQIIKKRKE